MNDLLFMSWISRSPHPSAESIGVLSSWTPRDHVNEDLFLSNNQNIHIKNKKKQVVSVEYTGFIIKCSFMPAICRNVNYFILNFDF